MILTCTSQLVRFEKVTTRGLESIGNVEFTRCCCCCGGLGISGNQFNPWICRLFLADEQIIQTVTSVQQLANMEAELEQALERVRRHKVHHFQLLKSYNTVHLRTKSSKKTLSIALCHIRSWNLKFCLLGTSTDLWKCLSTINILEFINNFVWFGVFVVSNRALSPMLMIKLRMPCRDRYLIVVIEALLLFFVVVVVASLNKSIFG